jgi:hypothetical protein
VCDDRVYFSHRIIVHQNIYTPAPTQQSALAPKRIDLSQSHTLRGSHNHKEAETPLGREGLSTPETYQFRPRESDPCRFQIRYCWSSARRVGSRRGQGNLCGGDAAELRITVAARSRIIFLRRREGRMGALAGLLFRLGGRLESRRIRW